MRKFNSIGTKVGYEGFTSFPACSVMINKSDIRIELLGSFDELQAWIAYSYEIDKNHIDAIFLEDILRHCQMIMGRLAMKKDIDTAILKSLEDHIEMLEVDNPIFEGFVIPGGSVVRCISNITRTMARRLERVFDKYVLFEKEQCHELEEEHEFYAPIIRAYINRLSDYMFLYSQV